MFTSAVLVKHSSGNSNGKPKTASEVCAAHESGFSSAVVANPGLFWLLQGCSCSLVVAG